jgi:DNA-binding transcriptional LysR family regulator
MLDDINELRTFVSIVGAGSLSAAAREMDLAPRHLPLSPR